MPYPSRKDSRLYGQTTSPIIIHGRGRGHDEPSHTTYTNFKHYYHNNLVSYALPVHHPFVHTVTQSREGRSRRLYCPSCLQPHNTRGRHALTRAKTPPFFHTVTRHEKRGATIRLNHDTSPFVLTRQAVRTLTRIVHPPHHTVKHFEQGLYASLTPQHSLGHTPQHVMATASHHSMYKLLSTYLTAY